MRVTDNNGANIGCSADFAAKVENKPANIVVVASKTNQTQCDPINGSITVESLTVNGVSVDGAAALASGYTFKLLNSDLTLNSNITATNGTGDPFIGTLPNATYQVQATNAQACNSALLEVKIVDSRTTPTVTFSSANNTNCTNPNGSITATINLTGDYEFQWYRGVLNNTSSPIGAPVTATGSNTVSNLNGGTYWVAITDKAGQNLGCAYNFSYGVLDDIFILDIVNPATDISNYYQQELFEVLSMALQQSPHLKINGVVTAIPGGRIGWLYVLIGIKMMGQQ